MRPWNRDASFFFCCRDEVQSGLDEAGELKRAGGGGSKI